LYPLLFGGTFLEIPTYYVVVSASALIGCLWFLKRATQERMPKLIAIDLTLVVLIAGFVGARLLHVFYEEPAYYAEHPWNVLKVWNGGFVYLGGMIAATVAAAFFCDFKREPFWVWADTAAPPVALAYALGRVGCFLNGCCYGRECVLPWAVFMGDAYRHPTQLYATFWELWTIAVLLGIEKISLKQRRPRVPGVTWSVWLIFHGTGRLIMERFRVDPRGPDILGLSISSWSSLALIVLGLALLLHFTSFIKALFQRSAPHDELEEN
jgi:phosphatidylglycerol:prolipoprotein diacylglycerol transferase